MHEYRIKLTPIYTCNKCGSLLKDGWHITPNVIQWYCTECGHSQREKEAPIKFVKPEDFFNGTGKNS